MVKYLTCYAEGRGNHWEAFCLDLDIAVTGKSFQDVYGTLHTAIDTYIEDVRKESSEQQVRLLNRGVPLSVRIRLFSKFVWQWLWIKRGSDGESASFTVLYPA